MTRGDGRHRRQLAHPEAAVKRLPRAGQHLGCPRRAKRAFRTRDDQAAAIEKAVAGQEQQVAVMAHGGANAPVSEA